MHTSDEKTAQFQPLRHSRASMRSAICVAAALIGAVAATMFAAPDAYASVTERVWGQTRFDTMAAISQKTFSNADTVIIATGRNFPDALAASSLAGLDGAPILLTEKGALPPQAKSEIERLGAKKAVIVGEADAVSEDVENELDALLGASAENDAVTRLGGANRIATMLEIYDSGKGSWGNTAIIAYGFNYPDALSISPYAYACKAPIFLAGEDGTIDGATADAIKSGGFSQLIIVGGTAVVKDSVVAAAGFSSATRLSGANRYDTSHAIASWLYDNKASNGMACDSVAVATGNNFPDALAGSSLCAKIGSPILLEADNHTAAACDYLYSHNPAVKSIYVLGGAAAVSEYARTKDANLVDSSVKVIMPSIGGWGGGNYEWNGTIEDAASHFSAETTGWPELDDRIVDFLCSNTNDGMSASQKLHAVYCWEVDNLLYCSTWAQGTYGPAFDSQASQSSYDRYLVDFYALGAMSTGYGVCNNFSGMYVAIARWLGVPMYYGVGTTHTSSGSFTGHAWCLLNDNNSWYVFDPNVDFYINGGQSYSYVHANHNNRGLFRYCQPWGDMDGTYYHLSLIYSY